MENKNRSKKILKDILIYGIGNLGSRLLTFLLIPIYTFYVKPSEFGYYDLAMNVIFVLMPFLTLQMKESVFRFLIDNDNTQTREYVITTTYKLIGIMVAISTVLGAIVNHFHPIKYFWLIAFTLYLFSWYDVQMQVVRGLKHTKMFVVISILTSSLIALFSYLFLVWMDFGIAGIFLANILSRLVSIIVIEIATPTYRVYLKLKQKLSFKNELVEYSLPLLPNVLCWSVISYSAPFFIQHYLGLEMNGIFAVALKFSTVLVILSSIFHQAWQETAVREFDKPDSSIFFSKLFNYYFSLIVTVAITFVFVLKVFKGLLIQEAYSESVQFVYVLAIGVCFYAVIYFIEFIYHCNKMPKLLLPAIFITTLFNIAANWLGVTLLGIWGIVFANLFTWVFLFILRFIKVQQYVRIKLDKEFVISLFEIIISAFVFYSVSNVYVLIGYNVLLLMVNCFIFKEVIQGIMVPLKLKLSNVLSKK